MAFDSTYQTTYAASNFKARVQDHAELKSARDVIAKGAEMLKRAAAGCEDKAARKDAMAAAAQIEAVIHDDLDHGALFALMAALDKLKLDYPATLEDEPLPVLQPITTAVTQPDMSKWERWAKEAEAMEGEI